MSEVQDPAEDTLHDRLRSERRPLDFVFRPRSVAVIGATDRQDSVGRTIVQNLLRIPLGGKIYLVNPGRSEVLGVACYLTIVEIPEPVDLAVVVTPAATVPGVIGECVAAGVKAVVVISGGFKERGAEGANLEQEIRGKLRGSKMRLIGPNCLGVMNPIVGLNATFASDMALPGSVAFLSQSGALETAILDWSLTERVGFSAMVSTGSMLDVGWGDLIDYFGEDEQTHGILMYIESVGDARSFVSAAREVALRKPIIVIKAGRSEAASRAATSHTGALTGSDEVFDAAARRCGILRVRSISDLFHTAEILDRQPRPRGPRLTIITNAGGPAVLAADELIADGGELAPLSDSSVKAMNQFLSPHWSHSNPVDVLGDAGPQEYAQAVEIAIADPNCDGLLAILAPQGMTEPVRVAECLAPYARGASKPILASWMGGKLVSGGFGLSRHRAVQFGRLPLDNGNAQARGRILMTVAELHPVFVSEPGRNGQGLIFDCPHCLMQRFVIYFANPLDGGLPMPPQVGAKNFRWQRSGDTKEDMSLTPSVNCAIEHDALPAAEGKPVVAAFTEQHWHGFFTNGEIVT